MIRTLITLAAVMCLCMVPVGCGGEEPLPPDMYEDEATSGEQREPRVPSAGIAQPEADSTR